MSIAERIKDRVRTAVILLTGVVPLAVQPGILAGDLAASSHVERLLDELPGDRIPTKSDHAGVDALLQALLMPRGEANADETANELPPDLWHVIEQGRLISMVTGAVTLQATTRDESTAGRGITATSNLSENTQDFGYVVVAELPDVPSSVTRNLSDENPLGP